MAPDNAQRTLVQTATYNEMGNLPRLVEAIFQHAPDVHVLVIDDNSPDGTGQWCDEQAAKDPRLRCLHRAGKLGLGTAIITGLRHGVAHGYKQVVNMDADWSHHPRHLPALIAGMDGGRRPVDVMIGSRYVPRGSIVGWPVKRHLMSRAINIYARLLLDLAPKDCSGGYRCYRCSLLAKIDFDAIRSRGYSFQEEILWHLGRLGARCGETPITFIDREHGTSKISSNEAYAALWVIIGLAVRNALRDAPLI